MQGQQLVRMLQPSPKWSQKKPPDSPCAFSHPIDTQRMELTVHLYGHQSLHEPKPVELLPVKDLKSG